MVRLVPMSEQDYQSFTARAIPHYAAEHVKDGQWTADESVAKATEEFNLLLPDGIHTDGQYLYVVNHTTEGNIGMLWFAVRMRGGKKVAFIYNIEIDDAFQGQGFGKDTLLALEALATEMRVDSIGLHVFGHNERAYRLYVKMGYVATNISMSKRIAADT